MLLTAVALAVAAFAGTASAVTATFTNTKRFLFDSDGNQIDAYGANINYFNGSYYMYGNSFAIEGVAFGIKSYSSPDLENWKYEGFLYDPYSDNPCNGEGGCGRPHIVYNANSTLYVLWANAGSNGYQVASSISPTGPFTFASSTAAIDPQFDGLQPADFAVQSFGIKAYIVFSALNFVSPDAGSIWPPIFQNMHISELTSDFMNTTQVSYPVSSVANDLIDNEAESPQVFKRNGTFYVGASNTCGYCNGSIGLLYRSDKIEGPWTRQIISGYSCEGQLEGVLALKDPNTGIVSDVWHSTTVPGGPRTGFSGHIFQPLVFTADGSAQDLDCAHDAEFTVDFKRGTEPTPTSAITSACDASPPEAVYSAVCDSDRFDLFQTWTTSGSGTLANVSVNIARGPQVIPLSLTVFKFDTYADLIAPEYKWTMLGTSSVNATQLSYVFNTTTVAVTTNATISAGDHLGLAINGQDFAPYCHLETDSGNTTAKLFQRGAGQNSLRGIKGNKSPVYERIGKEVKFFANYV